MEYNLRSKATNAYKDTRSHTVPLSIKIICSILMWLPIVTPFLTIHYFPRLTIIYNILLAYCIIITHLFMYATCIITFIKQRTIIFKFFNSSTWINIKKIFVKNQKDDINHTVSDILHIVIIPVYKEELFILENNFKSLAKQNVSMIIGLALEERESNSDIKYNDLIEKYEDKFIKIVKTIHPMNRPNEIMGKASNCNFCIQTLVKCYDENRLNLKKSYDHIMTSVCDCDTIWANDYFLYLNYLCTKNNLDNFNHIVYVPNISYFKHFQSSHMYSNWISIARSIGTHGHFYFLGCIRGFVSEYHIPLKLLNAIDYWDSDLVHEDVHMRNKLAILDGQSVVFKQTFLPCDNQTPTNMNSLVESVSLVWNQTLRWNLFIYDLYYLVYELLLNLFKTQRYENFRTNRWKILMQILINYEIFFFFNIRVFSNGIFWMLYLEQLDQQYYKETVFYLSYKVQPSFLILQMVLLILYGAFSLYTNDESTKGVPYHWKKQVVFLLGLTLFSFYFYIHHTLLLIIAWIQTLKGTGAHSTSAPKCISKSYQS